MRAGVNYLLLREVASKHRGFRADLLIMLSLLLKSEAGQRSIRQTRQDNDESRDESYH